MAILFEKSIAFAPLVLSITEDGLGVEGLSPTVALRDAGTSEYFDFADSVFKPAGWTLRDAPMTDLGRGRYERLLDIATTATLLPGMVLSAEFRSENGQQVGDATELVMISDAGDAVTLLRKLATNRLEESSGSPGLLRLYDDDGVTVLKTWLLRDESGGPTASSPGAPSRRGAAA